MEIIGRFFLPGAAPFQELSFGKIKQYNDL